MFRNFWVTRAPMLQVSGFRVEILGICKTVDLDRLVKTIKTKGASGSRAPRLRVERERARARARERERERENSKS